MLSSSTPSAFLIFLYTVSGQDPECKDYVDSQLCSLHAHCCTDQTCTEGENGVITYDLHRANCPKSCGICGDESTEGLLSDWLHPKNEDSSTTQAPVTEAQEVVYDPPPSTSNPEDNQLSETQTRTIHEFEDEDELRQKELEVLEKRKKQLEDEIRAREELEKQKQEEENGTNGGSNTHQDETDIDATLENISGGGNDHDGTNGVRPSLPDSTPSTGDGVINSASDVDDDSSFMIFLIAVNLCIVLVMVYWYKRKGGRIWHFGFSNANYVQLEENLQPIGLAE